MIRLIILTGCLVVCSALLSCQSYSTGLKQTVDRAQETAAVAALKTISTAQQVYSVTNGGAYGTFQQLHEAGYLAEQYNSHTPRINDYEISMEVGEHGYRLNADPAGEQAGRHLYLDSTSPLIRVNPTQPATAKDPLLQP